MMAVPYMGRPHTYTYHIPTYGFTVTSGHYLIWMSGQFGKMENWSNMANCATLVYKCHLDANMNGIGVVSKDMFIR